MQSRVSPIPSPRLDTCTWLPQPGCRGVTQRAQLSTWSWVLYGAGGKRCFDLPELGHFGGTWRWAISVRFWSISQSQPGTSAIPAHRLHLRWFTSHFQRAELCGHWWGPSQSTITGSGRLVLVVPARPKLEEITHQDGRMPDAPHLGLGPGAPGIRKSARRACETLSDTPWQ